jgi:hypothetical protein
MGVDLNGTALTSSSGLVATYGGNQVMKMGTTGILQRYNVGQPMFRAGGSGTAAGVSVGTANAWNPIILNSTNLNVGTCYNTSNGRFTVPVDGIYLVTGSTYFTGGAAGWHLHGMFWVNGTASARRPSSTGVHRMRGHGQTAGYIIDSESFEIISLIAGDYVNFYNYAGGVSDTHVPQYARFEGYLLA